MLLPRPLVLLSTLALVSSAVFAAPSPSVVDEVAALLKGSQAQQQAQDATTVQQASDKGADAKFWGRPAVGRRQARRNTVKLEQEKRMWGGGGTAVMAVEPESANEKRMWGGGGTAVMVAEPSTDNEKRMWGGGGTAVMAAEPEAANEKRMWGGGGTATMSEEESPDAEKRMWGGGGTATMGEEEPAADA
ncbi:hypothetical protein BCR35DRAFT_306899 [Leucosporidium creatinivorum]|uniref:Uncharacterized protein n=1 Tax=Leucosporidium creatinivorum TaxID=106004 RepID=A0A1Y2ERC5_9BASI|nr:hypothetical protein BCR35DRAFT_306882 [Leucosporidium creatinivorum]ORY74089.1 hypothetical protein BCR35DRAFT_306899 [Leucosporidium creatinivorum]